MLSAWQGWVPGRGGCLAGEGARWDHAASTCILRWPGNLPTLHCIYGLQIAWEGSLGTCRAGATVGIFDRCGMTSMNQATTLAGKQGSWDGMVHKEQSGGHVWVMPKHLPTWESRARLGHITVLVHVKTGPGRQALQGQAEAPACAWYMLEQGWATSGWALIPTGTLCWYFFPDSHTYTSLTHIPGSDCLYIYVFSSSLLFSKL